MPEGPSIVILKEEALHFKGRKVLEVSGNAKIDIQRVSGKTVTDIKSWGKHFLICFKGFTVRIHLLMFGSYRINEGKDALPRLSLKFTNGYISFYTCSVVFIEGDINESYDWSADIMAGSWDAKKAQLKLKAEPETMVCDALLDQNIFAGLGNIIKNEVLFNVKVHPSSKVGALPPRVLKKMIDETRDYAFHFLEWKKKFELKKNWLAHTKEICARCNIPLRKEHLGKTNRRTFYCDNCQILYQ